MQAIDVHAHIIVPEILREAAPEEAWRPRVDREEGSQIIDFNGKRITSAVREFVRIEKIMEEMSKAGVERAVLCPWVSLARYQAPALESLASCRAQNDALAALSQSDPQRIAALGMLPLQDIPLALEELERLMGLGLKGVEIGTHVNGVYPGDLRFRPFWERCEALKAFVFIHPLEGGGRPELQEHYLWNVVGNPVETTIAAAHMILNGVMETFPGLRVMLAHGGGALPALRGRLDRGFEQRPEINKFIMRTPSESLKMFYFDTITHEPQLLKSLVEFAGADHVLLGSDYPFDLGNEDPVGRLRSAGLEPAEMELVLGGNAVRLFWEAGQ